MAAGVCSEVVQAVFWGGCGGGVSGSVERVGVAAVVVLVVVQVSGLWWLW